jgi:hypothetical protein
VCIKVIIIDVTAAEIEGIASHPEDTGGLEC